MFIPGMLPIWFLFAGLFFVAVFLLLGGTFLRCIPDMFIPGMLIPGMLLMSCFFPVCLFRAVFFFFLAGGFDLDFDFGLLMPGMLDISFWAMTGMPPKIRKAANKNAHTLTRNLKLNGLMLSIIPPRKVFRAEKSCDGQTSSAGNKQV